MSLKLNANWTKYDLKVASVYVSHFPLSPNIKLPFCFKTASKSFFPLDLKHIPLLPTP